MKKISISILTLLFGIYSYASELKTKATITDVTVYLKGATITAKSKVAINKGVQTISITDLPVYIDKNSIQVSGNGDFSILGVKFETNYLVDKVETQEISSLEAKKNELEGSKRFIKAELEVYTTELALLQKNMALGGTQTGIQVVELEKAANFYRARLQEISKKQINLDVQLTEITKEITKIDNQLRLINRASKAVGEVNVIISSKSIQNIELELSYFILQASWQPYYDIRVDDLEKPVELTYKANVSQQTGDNWKNVNLTLSTGNPSLGGNIPTLATWFLQNQQPVYRKSADKKFKSGVIADASYEIEEEPVMYMASIEKADYKAAIVETNITSIDFVIQDPVSLESGIEPAQVTVQIHNLPAYYIYKCVPKLDKDAFLIAKLSTFEKYSLLSGEANLFFEGSYVGESYLNFEQANDTIELSLGRDKSIIVERTRVGDYTNNKVIAQKRKEFNSYDITIKNNKQNTISIVIIDQVPISTQQEITVANILYKDGMLDEKSGIIEWKYTIEKNNTKKLNFSYEITYPKSWIINK